MPAHRKPARNKLSMVQPGSCAHRGESAVGGNHPAYLALAVTHPNPATVSRVAQQTCGARQKENAELPRALQQQRVQDCSAQPQGRRIMRIKPCRCAGAAMVKADAGNRATVPLQGGVREAKLCQSGGGRGQQTLPAAFVDRRISGRPKTWVGDRNAQTSLCRRDGRRQPGRAPADHQQFLAHAAQNLLGLQLVQQHPRLGVQSLCTVQIVFCNGLARFSQKSLGLHLQGQDLAGGGSFQFRQTGFLLLNGA